MIICLVTDRRRLAPESGETERGRCLVQQCREAVAAGVDIVQVREPDLAARPLVELVRQMCAAAAGSKTRVVVNDRLDVALAADAGGVHLRADSLPWRTVRGFVPSSFVVGCSVHGVDEARAADGASYLVAGTVWRSASKSDGHRLLGVDGLTAVARAVASPVLAIGGVAVDRMRTVARSGAAGIAAIGLFMDDRTAACRACPLGSLVTDVRRSFDSATDGDM